MNQTNCKHCTADGECLSNKMPVTVYCTEKLSSGLCKHREPTPRHIHKLAPPPAKYADQSIDEQAKK